MTERYINADVLCKRLGINSYRLGLLLKERALPRARQIGDSDYWPSTVWDWEEVQRSSFVMEPEKWSYELVNHFGPTSVYYIAAGSFVKIGFTESVKHRLGQLACDNPVALELLYVEPGDEALEAYRHWELSFAHHRGEWFQRAAVEEHIERLKNDEKAKVSGAP